MKNFHLFLVRLIITALGAVLFLTVGLPVLETTTKEITTRVITKSFEKAQSQLDQVLDNALNAKAER